MPLGRYQIRNEYGLADPELYKAADKDDPEALLEGVAMAGLVGVLRQLGDLAEFAAEVFHDLHEEVMVTAARGHGLMARVQQLEAEVPSIEKVFLSHNDQTPFFTNSGVDWHPNFRMEQNLITRGDLPRFVMDSYEECRGPPRLFLLDKFDVAGAGACLKRYTDPSVFKVEVESSGIEGQRERKIRKVKKKGSRWRNGETPEVVPTSHAKLHQLFLEEHVENGHSDPARLVKLKRRPLHGSPFDMKSGKSYMEKFVGSPSPEHKVVCEVSVNQSPLRLTMDNSSESGPEMLDIGTVSPARKPLQGRKSTGSSPDAQEVVLKSFSDELDEEVITREIVKVHDPTPEDDASPHSIHKEAIEDELAVNGDRKRDDSLDGDQSDDLMSEVDNYMDALTTMESEMDTDNEYKPKDAHNFLKFGRQGASSDASDRHPDVPTNFSDSQSFGNSSVSDDGKSSYKKGGSSFSYSDTISNVAENMQSDSEGAGKAPPYDESCKAEIVNSPLDRTSIHVENVGSVSTEYILYDNIDDERAIFNSGEASGSSIFPDSNSLAENAPDKPPSEKMKLGLESLPNDQNDKNLMDSSIPAVSSEACLREEVKYEDPNMSVQNSNVSDLEREVGDGYANEIVQRDHADGFDDKSMVEAESEAPHPVVSPFVHPEVDEDAGLKEVSYSSDIVNHGEMDSAVNDISAAAGVESEILTGMAEPLEIGSMKEKSIDTAAEVSGDEHELAEIESKVDVVDRDTIQFQHDQANLNEKAIASHVDVDAGAGAGAKDDANDAHCVASDFDCTPSSDLVDIQESLPINQDSNELKLPINEAVLPELCMESQELKEIMQLDVASTDINPSSHQSVGEYVHESTHPDQTQNSDTSYTADSSILSSSEFNSQDMKSQLSCSVDSSEVAASSPACHLPEVETALGHSVELPTDQHLAESSFAARDEGSCETFNLHRSPSCHIEEPGVPSDHSTELQSAKCGEVCLQANEASFRLSDLQSEQMEIMSSIGQEKCGDASTKQDTLPSQELLMQPAAQEVNGTVLSRNPFESGFPSFSSVPQNSEELPPLPPLPPMQWRSGKFQPAPMVPHEEFPHLGQDGLLPTHPFRNDENSQTDSVLLGGENMHPSNDVLSVTSADVQMSKNSLEESVESPLEPTSQLLEAPMVATDGNKLQGSLSEEGAQSLNPSVISLEVTNEGPDYGSLASRETPVELSADPSASMATVEQTQTKQDHQLSHGQEINNLNQMAPESISEAKTPENSVQTVEVGERNSVDKSASSSTQHDLLPSLGEPSWLQNTLALPPTYEAGKPNGHKLPRPRNPLIDAVAAHDKSMLRKVAERVRPQLGQKAEERDSLLEQIRNKSFNLKPTTVTRPPSIQGMQGPKTNLRVAAILEKANAIRQALAGSDEDEDSDSWSDS